MTTGDSAAGRASEALAIPVAPPGDPATFPALAAEIRRLACEHDAVILAHSYERPEVQDIADHVGDSLMLSRVAASAPQSTIVFCGVSFMAETAKILSPAKRVLLPDLAADDNRGRFQRFAEGKMLDTSIRPLVCTTPNTGTTQQPAPTQGVK